MGESELNKKCNVKRYDAIDGLRVFSAIGIVLTHILANGNYALSGIIFDDIIPSFSWLVFLFMIISGFSMCCGYYDKIINNEISVGEFYSKRYAKIWPFFATLCILELIISPSINSLYEVFANLTLCFGLLPNANISVIGVGWFLGVVFVFYLVFPFFCYLLSDRRRAWFSFIVSLLFNELCSDYFGLGHTNFVYCAVFFFAGGLIFLYREQLAELAKKYKWVVLMLCIVATGVYYVMGGTIASILLMFSMYLVYAIGSSKTGVLRNAVTHFLSNISMEIYLSHMVVYRVMERLGVTHLWQNDLLSYVFISVGTLAGTIAFSIVAQYGIKTTMVYVRKNF